MLQLSWHHCNLLCFIRFAPSVKKIVASTSTVSLMVTKSATCISQSYPIMLTGGQLDVICIQFVGIAFEFKRSFPAGFVGCFFGRYAISAR